jgi:F-type H+-transporting ATPase subunit b
VNFLAAFALGSGAIPTKVAPPAAEASGLSINFFWVIVTALSFLIFLNLIYRFGFDPIAKILAERKVRIDQGLADADQAQKDREAALAERDKVLADARREAGALIATAQKAAEDLRASDIAATKAELARMQAQAAADIAAERDHVLADLRSQVADLALAAAGRVVSETMTDARQRRIVDEFVKETGTTGPGRSN